MANNQQTAQLMYETLCSALEAQNWRFKRDDEKMSIFFGVTGDDLPMQFLVSIDEERQVVRLLSKLPFNFPEDSLLTGSIATNQINYKLADGSFDYNVLNGAVSFRMTNSYRESLISEEMFRYMVNCAAFTIDKYNDKLEELATGKISLRDFFEFIG